MSLRLVAALELLERTAGFLPGDSVLLPGSAGLSIVPPGNHLQPVVGQSSPMFCDEAAEPRQLAM